MSVVSVVVGATTESSARVVAKVTTGPVRVAVAANPGMTSAVFYGPVSTVLGVASVPITGLDPDTRYWYQVEDNSVVDTDVQGSFRTHPPLGQPADFTFATSYCAGLDPDVPGVGSPLASDRISNHPVFATIAGKDPLWFSHLGDLHYYDLGSDLHGIVGGGSLDNYRASYDDILAQPNQALLYRSIAWQYVWDDHDYGPNDSDSTLPTKGNAQTVYRERVPHYPLPAGDGENPIYQSWQVGRVLFIASDSRSERSPNGDVDDANKSMLGGAQKTWMQSLLASSDAKFLVWISPSVWLHPDGNDTWASFQTERAELVAMFTDLGWANRMCIVWGDRHAMGIDSGVNVPGGMPGFQLGAMDSTPSGPASPDRFDQGPESIQRAQYGTVRINDVGASIEVTVTGWINAFAWDTFTFTVQVETPTPTPEPGPAPVATAAIRTQVTWLGCDAVTGQIIQELPDVTGQVSRVLGSYTSSQLTVPIPLYDPTGTGHARIPLAMILSAVEPARSMVVAVVNDVPTWAGIILPREGGTDAEETAGVVSVEGYLTRRFVRDHLWTQQDIVSVIAAGLLGDAEDIGGLGQGLGLVVDAPASGDLHDREYRAADHKTIYDALSELMGIQDGIEWTIDLDWLDDTHTAVKKIARVRKRIGIVSATPTALFQTTAGSVFSSTGASEASYSLAEDWSDGRGANYVIAYSSGEGEDQPVSDPAVDTGALTAGFPIFEHHFQPSTSIIDKTVLDRHAAGKLALLRDGTNTWKITGRWDAYPRYGVDWQIGDDVAYDLIGHRHPDGIQGQGRVIGFELDMQAGTMTPLLQEEAT